MKGKMKFVYVNKTEDRDILLAAGWKLMGQKEGTSFWAFLLDMTRYSDADEVLERLDQYVLSNVLMF